MRNRAWKEYICILLVLSSLSLQAIYYISGLSYSSLYVFFVISAVGIMATLYAIIVFPSRKYLVALLIFCLSIFFNLTYWYYSKDLPYIPPLDAIFHWKTADRIIRDGSVNVVGSLSDMQYAYSSYPGLHLVIALVSIITGLDSITLVKLFPLLYSLLPFLMYVIVRRIFLSERIAWIASFVMIFLPKWYPFPSYSRFVFIYVFMLILFLVYSTISSKRENLVLMIVTFASLSITHHLTNYLILVYLVFLLLFQLVAGKLISNPMHFFRRPKASNLSSASLLCLLVCGVLFPLFSVLLLSKFHLLALMKYLAPSYSAQPFSTGILGYQSALEDGLILCSLALSILVGVAGFLGYVRRYRWITTPVAFVVFIGLISIGSLPFINVNPTIMQIVRYRLVFVVFAALAPFIGYALDTLLLSTNKGRRKLSHVLTLFLLLSLSVSTIDLVPRAYYYFSQETSTGYLWEVRNYGSALYSGLLWYRDIVYTQSAGIQAIGDVPISSIGHGMLNLNFSYYWDLYDEPTKINENLLTVRQMGVKYIFVDELMTTYREQTDQARFRDPIPIYNIQSLFNNPNLSIVYNTGVISILRISD